MVWTRAKPRHIRRRRQCLVCGERFTTKEQALGEMVDGERLAGKLARVIAELELSKNVIRILRSLLNR